MAQGTPVVVSDLEIFREIGGPDGGAARFVPLGPAGEAAGSGADDSPFVLADRIRELEDPAVFAAASRAAIIQASKFSWESSARALVGLAGVGREACGAGRVVDTQVVLVPVTAVFAQPGCLQLS